MTREPNAAPDPNDVSTVYPQDEDHRYVDDHYGNCPYCGMSNGYVKVGKHYWFLCHFHRTKWRAPLYRNDGEIWKSNAAMLRRYKLVEPVQPATKKAMPFQDEDVLGYIGPKNDFAF